MLELWKTQKSVEYFIQTGYSTYCGFIAQYISFIDVEINEMMARPVNYPFRMIRQYTGNFVQSYITRVITEQVNLWVSLLERTEQMTDEFLANYINPTIGCLVGNGIGFFRYITTWDKSKKPFKKCSGYVCNSAMSARLLSGVSAWITVNQKSNGYHFNGRFRNCLVCLQCWLSSRQCYLAEIF